MAERMPEELRERFERKSGDDEKKEKHREALRKSRKAKMKRSQEKSGQKR